MKLVQLSCLYITLILLTSVNSLKMAYQQHQVAPLGVSTLRQKQLESHNKYRAMHSAPALKLNNTLNDMAQKYADKLADTSTFEHSGTSGVGQNLFWSKGYAYTAGQATKSWYDEIVDYNFNKPGFKSGTGHFTQVVWVGSKQVGFGFSVVGSQTYVVAMYSPPGNYRGQFGKNVLRKK